MMRSPASFTVVCRRPDGSIVIKEEAWRPLWGGEKFLRWPGLRGAVVLLESLVNGVSALTFSANQQVVVDETKPPLRSLGARAADQPDESSHLATWGMVAISLVFGLALFV